MGDYSMRRLFFSLLLAMCALSAFAYNESVSAISFNPSRLGAYTYLKAVYGAKLAGGLDTTTNSVSVNIKSKSTVTLQDENREQAHTCTPGNCTGADDTHDGNLNTIAILEPVEVASGHSITTEASMTQAVVKNATNEPADNGYTIDLNEPRSQWMHSRSAASTAGTSVTMYGGTLTASDDSYINSFSTGGTLKKLKIAADALDVKNNFHVLASFQLGGITIVPADSSPCVGGKCKKYQFVERLNIKNGENKIYKVLAVKVK